MVTATKQPPLTNIRNDLARLPGIRMAFACEINTDKELDEALLKRIMGGDTVSAQFSPSSGG